MSYALSATTALMYGIRRKSDGMRCYWIGDYFLQGFVEWNRRLVIVHTVKRQESFLEFYLHYELRLHAWLLLAMINLFEIDSSDYQPYFDLIGNPRLELIDDLGSGLAADD